MNSPRVDAAKAKFTELGNGAGPKAPPAQKRKHALGEISRAYQGLGGQPVSGHDILKATLNTVKVGADVVGYSPYRNAAQGEDYALGFLYAGVQVDPKIAIYHDVVKKAEPAFVGGGSKSERSVSKGEDPTAGAIVYKLGATTGFTAGIVTKLQTKTFEVEYIAHLGIGGAKFSGKGDSGSPVFSLVNDGSLVLRGIIAQVGAAEAGDKSSVCVRYSAIKSWLENDFGDYKLL